MIFEILFYFLTRKLQEKCSKMIKLFYIHNLKCSSVTVIFFKESLYNNKFIILIQITLDFLLNTPSPSSTYFFLKKICYNLHYFDIICVTFAVVLVLASFQHIPQEKYYSIM